MTPCGSDEVILLPVVGRSVLAPDVLSQNRELIRQFGIAPRRRSDAFVAMLSVPNSRRAIVGCSGAWNSNETAKPHLARVRSSSRLGSPR